MYSSERIFDFPYKSTNASYNLSLLPPIDKYSCIFWNIATSLSDTLPTAPPVGLLALILCICSVNCLLFNEFKKLATSAALPPDSANQFLVSSLNLTANLPVVVNKAFNASGSSNIFSIFLDTSLVVVSP